VVEGRATAEGKFRVSARYLIYPDGRRVTVPGQTLLPFSCGCGGEARRRRLRSRPEHVLQLGA
jgi:hypothetical protein